jgi:Protein of unknown function (DUF4231)
VSGQEPTESADPPGPQRPDSAWKRWRKRRKDKRALLVVWPRARFRPFVEPLLPPTAATDFPFLGPRIAVAEKLISSPFTECDRDAQIEQNRWRGFTVLALAGGLATTVFGAMQAWLQSAWPGVIVVTAGAATTAVTTLAKRQGSYDQYRDQRLRAERLRSIYYEYLVATDADADRSKESKLQLDVALARYGKADK